MNTDNTPHSTPGDNSNVVVQDNLMDSVELFNTDIDQEWCGFLDSNSTNPTTTVISSSSSVCALNSTISSNIVTTTATTCVVTCSAYHDSISTNSRGGCAQTPEHMTTNSVVSQFTG